MGRAGLDNLSGSFKVIIFKIFCINSYQENWREIHEALQTNAKQAADVDSTIAVVHDSIEQKYSSLSDFVAQLSSLKELNTQLEQVIQHVSK